MASTYSTNLALELIGTGEQSGTWGNTTNTNLGTLIEQAISGYVTQAITDGADTTITIPNGATGVARNMYIEMTGALTAARNLIVPANKKLYFIYNNTTGGFAVTVKVSGQTGVSVPNGSKTLLVSNGTDVVAAVNYLAALTLGAALPVASGGTGATTAAGAATNLAVLPNATFTTKGDIVTATGASTPVRKAVGTNGQIIVADSTQSDGLIWTDFSKDPLNVNPNMLLDQINEGALYTVNTTGVQGPDGWTGNAAGAGVFKLRRIADPDNAARYVTEITCTTADAAIGATDKYEIYTSIEGYDIAQLAPGTASAGKITVQFQFKTNVTGTYCIALQNSAQNRAYIGTITVSDTSVHDYSVTLTLDTSGTWLYTNGVGCYIFFGLAVGSDFQGSGGSWQAGNYHATSAQANFMSANTNVAYLGRFHIIPGNVVCAYKPADIQRELAKAQRYYVKTFPQGTAVAQNAGTTNTIRYRVLNATIVTDHEWALPVEMRAAPTVVTYNPSASNANWRDLTSASDHTAVVDTTFTNRVNISNQDATTAEHVVAIHATANARLS